MVKDQEYFPVATFALFMLILAIYPFSQMNISLYSNIFGFTPAHPQPWTIVTYLFIHADLIHLIFNIVFLLIAGLTIEQVLGKWNFLTIYFGSGLITLLLDSVGRLFTNVSFSTPLIGASGAIFGVITIAALLRPFEKVPSLLAILAFLPLMIQLYFTLTSSNIDTLTLFLSAGGIFVLIMAIVIMFITPMPLILLLVFFFMS
ncbi:MAG TPA: rhomboid family intramembrane serine protease, partial [archaeon]|nr:rhomboid family intramembrane serine protease [archaeon]